MEFAAPNDLAHFAINATDVDVARAFYTAVFDWQFEAAGPPDFFRISTRDGDQPGPIGVVQRRRELLPGVPTTGFECTVAVDDVDAVVAAVEANGGRILMTKTTIRSVGDLVFFADPDGNVCGAMRYESE
jgi:uncharacterized protein